MVKLTNNLGNGILKHEEINREPAIETTNDCLDHYAQYEASFSDSDCGIVDRILYARMIHR